MPRLPDGLEGLVSKYRDSRIVADDELEQRVAEGYEVSESVREFIERFTGRPIGVQLLLPLREF